MRHLKIISRVTLCYLLPVMGLSQELPIKATRTISFKTDKASYMNVNVSPDGKTLAFDMLGDIYTVPSSGGNAKRVTNGIAIKQAPVWSPDGKSIAYRSDESGDLSISVDHLQLKARTVFPSSKKNLSFSIVWKPDGRSLFSGGFEYNILSKMVTPSSILGVKGFDRQGFYAFLNHKGKLVRRNLADLSSDTLCVLDDNGMLDGILSADGNWWVYIYSQDTSKSLIAFDIKKRVKKVLVRNLTKARNFFHGFRFNISPDSKYAYISYGGKIHRIGIQTGSDIIIPISFHVKVDLGPYNYNVNRISDDSFTLKHIRSANLNFKGDQIVFTALNKAYIMDLQTKVPRELVDQPFNQFQPSFSPDGKQVCFVSWSDQEGGAVWIASSTGGPAKRLTTSSGQYQKPSWSPDGKHIAVIKGEPEFGDRDDVGNGVIEYYSVYDGKSEIIADSATLWNNISFSNDGERIYYRTRKSGYLKNNGVFVYVSLDINGKSEKIVAKGDNRYGSWQAISEMSMSPDEKYLVYSMAGDLFILPADSIPTSKIIFSSANRAFLGRGIRFANGVDIRWQNDSKKLSWNYANNYYSTSPDSVVSIANKKFGNLSLLKENVPKSVSIELQAQVLPILIKGNPFYGDGVVALTNARIISMKKDLVIERGTVIVKNGRIIYVGPSSAARHPEGSNVIDLHGYTIMPGLVDIHDHMRVPGNIFPEQSWMFKCNLAYGVTTSRDPSLSYDSYGYAELLATGRMLGPRLLTVGRPVRMMDGIPSCDSLKDATRVVEKRVQMGGTEIKQYGMQTRIQRQWILKASLDAKMNMTNEGYSDPILQLGMIKDGSTGVEHNAAWGDVFEDIIQLIARSGTYITPTLQVGNSDITAAKEYFNYAYWRNATPKMRRFIYSDGQVARTSNGAESLETILGAPPSDSSNFLEDARIQARIYKAGGKITLGSHGNDQGIGAHNEVWALKMGGLTNMEALHIGTIRSAEAIGMQKDIGSIEVGKIADLIILTQNPLESIYNTREIKYVMKAGVLYVGDTLEKVWPVK